jgi:hypothetical protein
MAFVNLPPNLQDMFNNLGDRVAKLETGPSQAMYTADTAQTTASSAQADATTAISNANAALAQANIAYALAGTSLQKDANTITNSSNNMTAINANGITVYSGASMSSGARVIMNSAGIAGYNSSGTATFAINASTGAASFSGNITGSAITGSTLNISGNCIIDSSGFLTATGATITGTITATSGSFTGSLYSSSGTIGGWTLNSSQLYSGTGAYMNASNGNIGGNAITAFTSILSYGSITTTSGASIESAGLLHAAGNLQVDTTSTVTYSSSTYNIALIGVSSPAAIGRFYKTTSVSSRRFKHNIEPFIERDYLNIINKISPVTFNYNADVVENPEVTAYGLIAEDVQEIPQTDDLIIMGQDNQPEAIAYDRLNWYVIKALQQLSNKVDAIQKEGK